MSISLPERIIEGRPCHECGAERLASVIGICANAERSAYIGYYMWCQRCTPLDNGQAWNAWFAVGRNRAGEWRWWLQNGSVIDEPAMDVVTSMIRMMGRHLDIIRESRLKTGNQPWALELRSDGQVWIPYNRQWAHSTRHGEPLVLRRAVIKASKRKRKCYACHLPLQPGSVWRPTVSSAAGWSSIPSVLVCDACYLGAGKHDAVDRRVVRVGKRTLVVLSGGE